MVKATYDKVVVRQIWKKSRGPFSYLRGLERVVSGEVDGQKENSALVWAVGRSHDSGLGGNT